MTQQLLDDDLLKKVEARDEEMQSREIADDEPGLLPAEPLANPSLLRFRDVGGRIIACAGVILFVALILNIVVYWTR